LAGNRFTSLPAFNEEAARLQSPALRAALAKSLARALHDAEHWNELLVASRPPWGVRRLTAHAAVIHAIIDALGASGPHSLRATVLLEWLIQGGYGSALYESHDNWLAGELARIHFELTLC
jgi:hypothetical protein